MKELIDNLNEIILQKDTKIEQLQEKIKGLQEEIDELLEYKKAYCNNFPN